MPKPQTPSAVDIAGADGRHTFPWHPDFVKYNGERARGRGLFCVGGMFQRRLPEHYFAHNGIQAPRNIASQMMSGRRCTKR
jgi:hypothetical protein